MSFLFAKGKVKTPQELVAALYEWTTSIDDLAQAERKPTEEIAELLQQAKRIAHGELNGEADPDLMAALAKEMYANDLIIHLIHILDRLDFEARRDVASLFSFLLRRTPTVEYLLSRPQVFDALIESAGSPEVYRNVGSMLRDCAKHPELTRNIMAKPSFWYFFDYCRDLPFEVGSDCFTTLAEFLRCSPELSAEFLAVNGKKFSHNMNTLMLSDNYVTKRQALKLMGQLIRERANQPFMVQYIEDLSNLKLVMRLLRDRSKNIHMETFQLFKVFVANPRKPAVIFDVLAKNKQRLLEVLSNLGADRKDDKQFNDERLFVMRRIKSLPDVGNSKPPASKWAAQPSPESSPPRSPARSRSPEYMPPSGPPSPSRAQIPAAMQLGHAAPVLNSQLPQLGPPEHRV